VGLLIDALASRTQLHHLGTKPRAGLRSGLCALELTTPAALSSVFAA